MLIDATEEKLQNILTTVTIESENKGLQLSAWPSQNILCKGERIKQVGTFKYSGFTITTAARFETEIKKRTALPIEISEFIPVPKSKL